MIDTSALKTEAPITWRANAEYDRLFECMIGGQMVAWIVARPSYCDRGHWQMNCELPDLDAADSFPRYYMDLARAKVETEEFLRWRLWHK